MSDQDYSYIGVGKLHLRVVGALVALAHVGNCSALSFDVTQDEKSLRDFTQGGGGERNSAVRVSAVGCSMTLTDLSPTNLARAIFGETTAIVSAAVTDEAIGVCYAGGISITAFPIDLAVAPVVEHAQNAAAARANSTAYTLGQYYIPAAPNGFVYKCTVAGTSAAAPPVFSTTVGTTFADGTATFRNVGKVLFVEDTDYTVSAGGITALDAIGMYAGESWIASYTKADGHTIEALLNSAPEYELFFDGLNEARSGKAVIVHAFRVKFGPTNGLQLIGDDYFAGEQTGKVLKDTTKNGTSLSQYFRSHIVA